MSQNWTSDCFAAGHAAQTDLQNMKNNFLALHTSFSGAVQPAGAAEGTLWRDTAKKVLKQYNGASWFGMFHGDATQKILVYDNTLLEGYLRDASVTDKVIALKGGATYVTAGATAGLWAISGLSSVAAATHTHSHSHKWYDRVANSGSDDLDGAGTSLQTIGTASKDNGAYYIPNISIGSVAAGISAAGDDMYTDTNAAAGGAHSHTITHDGTSRIAAAVVMLEYLDL